MLTPIKIIFLDIDGVLNLISQGHDQYGSIFHEHLVDNLRKIVDETGAKIVISSTWRFDGLDVMQDMWKSRNYPGEVIDITESYIDKVAKEFGIEYYDDIIRGHEIELYLHEHPSVVDYVILDDDTDMLPSQMNNYVQTSGNKDHPDCIDIGYGLTSICAQKAIDILNKSI